MIAQSPSGGERSGLGGNGATKTGLPAQLHFGQTGRSKIISGSASLKPRSGDSRCEPQEGQRSGTPRTCRINAVVNNDRDSSVEAMPASASLKRASLA